MPTAAAERHQDGRASIKALALGVVGCLALAGCSSTPETPPPQTAPALSASPAPNESTVPVPPDLLVEFRGLLNRRADAVRRGDRVVFQRGVAKARPDFLAEQLTYFDNLIQLPIGELAFTVDRGSLLRTGDDYWVAVDVVLQLEGFDALPVTRRDRYRFSPVRRDPGRFVLSSVTDEAWEERVDTQPQPWDLGAIDVVQGVGVLGIFDDASLDASPELVSSVERGIADVAAQVPYAWDRSVVVYALSDPAFLASIDDLPGGDPTAIDGVSFPVDAGPGSNQVASTRFVLNPGMLGRGGLERDRLVRHELTHVALGQRDDQAPVWLSEGLAEYVSVQPLAPEDRRITPQAIEAAEAGVEALPADDTFNSGASSANYGLSWWACEYVAATYGPSMLWTLLDYVTIPGADPGKRMQMTIGLNSRQLARAAARLLIATFDPAFLEPTPSPSPSPTPGATTSPTVTPVPAG